MESIESHFSQWQGSVLQAVLQAVKPAVYVESGMPDAHLFNMLSPLASKAFAVLTSNLQAEGIELPAHADEVKASVDDVLAQLLSENAGIDFLFLHNLHSKEKTLTEFWQYFPSVTDHGIIVIDATHPAAPDNAPETVARDIHFIIEDLKLHPDIIEFMSLPVEPGLTFIRKRRHQLKWSSSDALEGSTDVYYLEQNLRKSITMPNFVAKIKQMFPREDQIKVIFEIGALDGRDSLYFKSVFPYADVHTVEALPDNFQQFIKSNPLLQGHNLIISNKDGVTSFYQKEINGIHSIYNRGVQYAGKTITLPTRRMDTLIAMRGLGKVDAVKIDVEGATLDVLEGFGSALTDLKIMHIETESFPFFTGQRLHVEVAAFLTANGFQLLELTSFPIQPGRFQYDSIWFNTRFV